MIDDLGRKLLEFLEETGDVTILSVQTIFYAFKGNFHYKDLVSQMVRIGVDSLPVAVVTAAFVGMVFAVQIASEFVKFGAGNVVGGSLSRGNSRRHSPPSL